MEKSETINNLAKALIDFHSRVQKIKKDAKNPFFKSNYASLSNIQDAISGPLAEAGLAYSQMPSGVNGLSTILISLTLLGLSSECGFGPVAIAFSNEFGQRHHRPCSSSRSAEHHPTTAERPFLCHRKPA
jgi:hypothetical protein